MLIILISSFILSACSPRFFSQIDEAGFFWILGLLGLIMSGLGFNHCNKQKDKKEEDRCGIYSYTVLTIFGIGGLFIILSDL